MCFSIRGLRLVSPNLFLSVRLPTVRIWRLASLTTAPEMVDISMLPERRPPKSQKYRRRVPMIDAE
jgi:hypothetical protein